MHRDGMGSTRVRWSAAVAMLLCRVLLYRVMADQHKVHFPRTRILRIYTYRHGGHSCLFRAQVAWFLRYEPPILWHLFKSVRNARPFIGLLGCLKEVQQRTGLLGMLRHFSVALDDCGRNDLPFSGMAVPATALYLDLGAEG